MNKADDRRWARGDLFCLGGVGELQRRDLSRAWRGLVFGLGVKSLGASGQRTAGAGVSGRARGLERSQDAENGVVLRGD